jgi:ribosome assembly protein 1
MPPTKTPNASRGTIRGSTLRDVIKFTIRASPIPKPILNLILDNIATLKRLTPDRTTGEVYSSDDSAEAEYLDDVDVQGSVIRKPPIKPEQFWSALQDACKDVGGDWADITENIMAFGPQKAGGCMLIDRRKNSASRSCVYSAL